MIKLYISFKRNCKEALNFYKDCFDSEFFISSTYGDIDEDCIESDKELVLHSEMDIEGTTFIFNDYIDESMVIGNNFSVLIECDTTEKVMKYYEKLKRGGCINIEIGETEFSELYVNLTDRFGVNWIVMK